MTDGEDGHTTESERSAALAKEQGRVLEARQVERFNSMEKLDLKAAHAACFKGGNHGTITVTEG